MYDNQLVQKIMRVTVYSKSKDYRRGWQDALRMATGFIRRESADHMAILIDAQNIRQEARDYAEQVEKEAQKVQTIGLFSQPEILANDLIAHLRKIVTEAELVEATGIRAINAPKVLEGSKFLTVEQQRKLLDFAMKKVCEKITV